MQGFPKWLLVAAFACAALGLIESIFFLFGGLAPFGKGLLAYALTQLIWLLPISAFFVGLRQWDHRRKTLAVLIFAAALILAVSGGIYIVKQL